MKSRPVSPDHSPNASKPAVPLPGFDDPVGQSQAIFRAVLDAMARPGRLLPLPALPAAPAPLPSGLAAIALALADNDTPLWLDAAYDTADVRAHLAFHTGCPFADRTAKAAFALVPSLQEACRVEAFANGTPEYPDRSTTVIVAVDGFDGKNGQTLTGPGIEISHRLNVAPECAAFWEAVRRNRLQFPLGTDFILVAGERIAALPRTVRVAD